MSQKALTSGLPAAAIAVKILAGPHKGESFTLTKTIFTIGRSADNDVVLPNDSKISRNHVSVNKRAHSYVVENMSQRNPLLQGQEQKSKIELFPGHRFQIGESEIEFFWDSPESKPKTPDSHRPQPQNPAHPHLQNHLALPKSVSQIPVQSGNKKINITINHSYEALNQKITATHKKKKIKPKTGKNNLLIVIILIVAIAVIIMSPSKENSQKPNKSRLRTSEEMAKDLERSKVNIETYKKQTRIQEDGSIEKQFESAQSYYIRGFRDYRQGQFSRSIQAFQAALSFDPNHVLSRKYLNASLKKLDELVQFNINQGRRYREKSNFRLCKSAFQQVMVMKKDPNDPVYKEAKQLYDECEILHKGRY
jgi:pSer/pThr/pTyr-binding forkhead associated (FHA) protein